MCLTVSTPSHTSDRVCCLHYPCSSLWMNVCKCSCPGQLKSRLQLNFSVNLLLAMRQKLLLGEAWHHISQELPLVLLRNSIQDKLCHLCFLKFWMTFFGPRGKFSIYATSLAASWRMLFADSNQLKELFFIHSHRCWCTMTMTYDWILVCCEINC